MNIKGEVMDLDLSSVETSKNSPSSYKSEKKKEPNKEIKKRSTEFTDDFSEEVFNLTYKYLFIFFYSK